MSVQTRWVSVNRGAEVTPDRAETEVLLPAPGPWLFPSAGQLHLEALCRPLALLCLARATNTSMRPLSSVPTIRGP